MQLHVTDPLFAWARLEDHPALATLRPPGHHGLIALRNRDKLHYIMSLPAGVLVAVCFFDILPEVFRLTADSHLNLTPAMVALVIGFLTFHVLEKTIVIHSTHEEEYASHHHPTVGVMR